MVVVANTTLILTTAFFAFVVQVIFNVLNIWGSVPLLEANQTKQTTKNTNTLKSHPMCGITSGGREECWWRCEKKLQNQDFTFFLVNKKIFRKLIKLFLMV